VFMIRCSKNPNHFQWLLTPFLRPLCVFVYLVPDTRPCAQALSVLEQKINEATELMREEHLKKRRDRLMRMQMDLEDALIEEDYEKATRLREELELEARRREGTVSPSKLWKKIDAVWLDGEINNKIQQLRSKEEKILEDPVARLQHEMKTAIDEEDFERAAIAREMLIQEEHKRDLDRMEKSLNRECGFRKLEVEKLKQQPIAYLAQKLQDEIDAEDYEAAFETCSMLARKNLEAVMADMVNRTREARETFERLDQISRLEIEQEGAVADEDYQAAVEIRDKIMSMDAIRRLQWKLSQAVDKEKYSEAAELKRELMEAYTNTLSPAVLTDMGYMYKSPLYKVGDVIEHAQDGYRGVVVGWHDSCRASDDWAQHTSVDKIPGVCTCECVYVSMHTYCCLLVMVFFVWLCGSAKDRNRDRRNFESWQIVRCVKAVCACFSIEPTKACQFCIFPHGAGLHLFGCLWYACVKNFMKLHTRFEMRVAHGCVKPAW
jgi:protein-arginine kinase activator protein McsA